MLDLSTFDGARKAVTGFIKGKSNFVIGYHPDADGIAATTILAKHLKSLGVREESLKFYPINNLYRSFDDEHLKEIETSEHDAIIQIDSAISDNKQIEHLSRKYGPVMCIDHHHYKEGLEKIPQVYINSVRFKGVTRPDLFTTSKLMNSIFYDPANDWLELVGLEGDVVVQSVNGMPIQEVASRLNTLGLIGRAMEPLDEKTLRRNKLVKLAILSNGAEELLSHVEANSHMETLFQDIISDINLNLDVLKEKRTPISFSDNKIYVNKIISEKGFEIAEHILKAHIKHLGYNETFIIYSEVNNDITLRAYTSNTTIDCEKVVRKFGGGGHQRRAGITNYRLDSTPVDSFVGHLVDSLKGEIAKRDE
jgi:hypothetical protein